MFRILSLKFDIKSQKVAVFDPQDISSSLSLSSSSSSKNSKKSNAHIHILDSCAFALDGVKNGQTNERKRVSGSRMCYPEYFGNLLLKVVKRIDGLIKYLKSRDLNLSQNI